jgi:hypothetical protein
VARAHAAGREGRGGTRNAAKRATRTDASIERVARMAPLRELFPRPRHNFS